MMRRAVARDLPALLALLRSDEAGSMFPLVNLADGSLTDDGIAGNGPHAMRVWLSIDGGSMVGLTRAGALLPQSPGGDWRGLRDALAGETVTMVIGRGNQVPGVLAALGLDAAPTRHADEEPGFVLDLDALLLPDPEGCDCVPLTGAHRAITVPWRAAYLAETFSTPMAEAATQAGIDVDRWIANGSHRVLLRDGAAVAMSGFNAALPEVVQVGGVYTPPALRGQGFARRVVAAHLAGARAQGVRRAVLFAANDRAAAAYRAIGFQRSGSMSIVQFYSPQQVLP